MRFQALTWELVDKFPRKVPEDANIWERTWCESAMLVHICGRDARGDSVHVCCIDYTLVFYARCSPLASRPLGTVAPDRHRVTAPAHASSTQ